MKQYCRYCAYCIDGNGLYCTCHDKILSESKIKSVNQCKDFTLTDMGDILTGRQYKPRKPRQYNELKENQLRLDIDNL